MRSIHQRRLLEATGISRRPGLWLAAGLAAWAMASAGLAQTTTPALVPANFSQKVDSQGNSWYLDGQGYLRSGTFSSGNVLQINGNSFNATQPMMTPDGLEYVFSGTAANLGVTRRVKLDLQAAAVRYLEVLTNATPASITATVSLTTSLNYSPYQAFLTDGGTQNPATLGKKDSGVIVVSNPQQGHASLVFHLADARSKLKPAIQAQHQHQFVFTYPVTIDPGKSVAILHGVAQRRLAGVPDAKTAAGLMKPFAERAWTKDLDRAMRRTIANLGGLGLGDWTGETGWTTLETIGVERQAADILAVGEQTRLRGVANCRKLTVTTRYGTAEVPWEQVAALCGGAATGKRPRVFLEDGQVYSGEIAAEGLHYTMNSGLAVRITLESLDRLVCRERLQPASGQGITVLETNDGDRLALAASQEQWILAATPWGERKILLGDVVRLMPAEEGPGCRLVLRDGSRLFAFLGETVLKLETVSFGPQQFPLSDVRAVLAVQAKPSQGDQEPTEPHMLLRGENVLVGQVDLDALRFIVGGQEIPLPPEQVRNMRRYEDGATLLGGKGPAFEAELWDGSVVAGQMLDLELPVRCGQSVARVPPEDVLEYRVPAPSVPDEVRSRIAEHIRDLGHPDYAKREAARQALKQLGHLPSAQLQEAKRQATDPEVRRSVEALLEELP